MEIAPALSHGGSQSSDGRGVTLALHSSDRRDGNIDCHHILDPPSSLSKYTLGDDRLARIKSVAAVDGEHQRKRGKDASEIRVQLDVDTL